MISNLAKLCKPDFSVSISGTKTVFPKNSNRKEAPNEIAIIPVVDPDAAQLAHKVGLEQKIELQLGHKIDPKWGEPILLEAVVTQLSDGAFTYRGGIWDGRVGCMGQTAVLKIGSIIRVLADDPAATSGRSSSVIHLGEGA